MHQRQHQQLQENGNQHRVAAPDLRGATWSRAPVGFRPAAQQLLLGVHGDPQLVVHSGPAFAPVHPGPGHATQPRPQPAHAAGGGEAEAGGGAEEGCSTAGEAEVRLVFLL